MKKSVIVSKKDQAGMNILENLEILGYKDTVIVEKDSISCENIDEELGSDLIIFATKHRSKSGIPSLSIHVPGNWSSHVEEDFGGSPRQLCTCPAAYIREGFNKLKEINTIGYEVVIECTHHGPYLKKPCLFIEIGSTEKEWPNKEAGKIIAQVILHLLKTEPEQRETLFGIGGLHTTPILSKCIEKGYDLGHVCPKYMLESLDKEMIQQALDRCVPGSKKVLLDWKGMGPEKQRMLDILNDLSIETLRTDHI